VNNYYKSGPAANVTHLTQVTVAASGNAGNDQTFWGMTSRYYVEGNTIDGNAAGWEKIIYDNGTLVKDGEHYTPDPNHYYGNGVNYLKNGTTDYVRIRMDEAAPIGEVTTHTAANAYEKVLTYSGASLHPDDVDVRYFSETRSGTATYSGSVTKKKGRIDLVADVNGYTEANFGTGSRKEGFDTDDDGIPDDWETANGLNPNDANDACTYTLDTKGWYTNLEVYANSLVENIMKAGNAEGRVSQDFFGRVKAPFRPVNNKVIVPDAEEEQQNPRSRSAKLRIAEKV
jgi:hypothetical protein